MPTHASEFVGSIPENYDIGLGPLIFFESAIALSKQSPTVPIEALTPASRQ